MPNVEDSRIRRPDDFHAAPDVLPVEHHVLAAPAYDVLVEAADLQEVGPATNRHVSLTITDTERFLVMDTSYKRTPLLAGHKT